MLTGKDLYITIGLISLTTFLTRALPFLLFGNKNKKPPEIIFYLGKYLPPALLTCILVYTMKDVNFLQSPFGIREIVSVSVVFILHWFRGNSMVSIVSGTVVYMLFTQLIYAS